MYKALTFFGELEKEDLDWIIQESFEQQVIAETVIIKSGEQPEAIYFVLDGLVNIVSATLRQTVATIGNGDIFGEMSFVENKTASATVSAAENTLLLLLPRDKLREKVNEDTAFASRFYRACAIVTAKRLRTNLGLINSIWKMHQNDEDSQSPIWKQISGAIHMMKELFQEADKQAIQNDDELPEETAKDIRTRFQQFVVLLNDLIGDEAPGNDLAKAELGALVQQEMLPYLLLTHSGERFYSKPRGYAGDFMSIEYIYRDEATGSGSLGPYVDRCFLDVPAAVAVRNRRGLLADEIQQVLGKVAEGETAQITSMASGPAAEIFDVFGTLDNKRRMKATCIDIDLQALAFVGDKRDKVGLKRQIRLENANLVYLAIGRQKLDIPPQDLVYSIGLIDYFSDEFVVNLLNYVHTILKPGGRVILGNFHPQNKGKALMDYVLEWKLIHRTEDDMHRIFKNSAFNAPCSNIRFEDQGINLFAMCEK